MNRRKKLLYITKYLHIFKIDENTFLLLNTLTGAIDIVDRKIREFLVSDNEIDIESDITARLRERNYLYDSEQSEVNFFNNLITQITQAEVNSFKIPYFYLFLTYNCNLRCIYCNESDYVYPGNNINLTPPQVDAALAVIVKLTSTENLKKRPIILYGGEPLMESTYDIVAYLLNKVRIMQMPLVIITNGTRINIFKEIISTYDPNKLSFIITIDGPRQIHDSRRPSQEGWSSFTAIVENIEYLLLSGFQIELQVILDKQNIEYLSDLCNFIIDRQWHLHRNGRFFIGRTMFVNPQFKYKYVLSEEEFVALLFEEIRKNSNIEKIFKKFTGGLQIASYLNSIFVYGYPPIPKITGCRACRPGLYAFCPDGFIYPCLELINFKEYALGKFYPQLKLDSAQLKRWRSYGAMNNNNCKHCKFLLICQGGCPARKFIGYNSCPNVSRIIDVYLRNRLSLDFKNFSI